MIKQSVEIKKSVFEIVYNVLNGFFKVWVFIHRVGDLFIIIHNCGVIPSADVKTDRLIAQRGSFLDYVSADLSCERYLRCSFVGEYILGGNSVDFGNVERTLSIVMGEGVSSESISLTVL